MQDDLERELDGIDDKSKKKFRTGTPGKTSNDVIFSETKTRKPGDIGRQAAAQFDKPKLLTTKKQVLEERLRRLKEKEFEESGK